MACCRRDRKIATRCRPRRRCDAQDPERREHPADDRPARPHGSGVWRRSRSAHRRSRAFAAGCRAAPSPGQDAPRPTLPARIRCGCRAATRRGRRLAGPTSGIPPRSVRIAGRLPATSSACRHRPAPRHRDFWPLHPQPSPRCFRAAGKTPARRGRRNAPRAAWPEWNSATSPCSASPQLFVFMP